MEDNNNIINIDENEADIRQLNLEEYLDEIFAFSY